MFGLDALWYSNSELRRGAPSGVDSRAAHPNPSSMPENITPRSHHRSTFIVLSYTSPSSNTFQYTVQPTVPAVLIDFDSFGPTRTRELGGTYGTITAFLSLPE